MTPLCSGVGFRGGTCALGLSGLCQLSHAAFTPEYDERGGFINPSHVMGTGSIDTSLVRGLNVDPGHDHSAFDSYLDQQTRQIFHGEMPQNWRELRGLCQE